MECVITSRLLILEEFGSPAEFAASSRSRRRPGQLLIGERWTDADDVPHRLIFVPGSGELVLNRVAPADRVKSVNALDLPVDVAVGPVVVVAQRRALVAGNAWDAWRRKRDLCRNELRGWRKAMRNGGSLQWLAERLSWV